MLINLLKIDVEGHEIEVLKGFIKLIRNKVIKNIIYEDHNEQPSNISKLLVANGYTVFRICNGLTRPLLLNPNKNLIHPVKSPNYLATFDPFNSKRIFKKYGWYSIWIK